MNNFWRSEQCSQKNEDLLPEKFVQFELRRTFKEFWICSPLTVEFLREELPCSWTSHGWPSREFWNSYAWNPTEFKFCRRSIQRIGIRELSSQKQCLQEWLKIRLFWVCWCSAMRHTFTWMEEWTNRIVRSGQQKIQGSSWKSLCIPWGPPFGVLCGVAESSALSFLMKTLRVSTTWTCSRTFFWPEAADLPEIDEIVFMQDGAPPHFSRDVRAWLDETFPDRWIGRRGPTEWPPRSPDLTPCDFWLWGHLKHLVYQKTYDNLEELKQAIRDACASIGDDVIERSLLAFKERLHRIIETNGDHIENLL